MKNTNEIMEKVLNQIEGKNFRVMQEGFIESSFTIENIHCNIVEDILAIIGENIYIRININQIYNVEITQKAIILFLDNDTKISIIYY